MAPTRAASGGPQERLGPGPRRPWSARRWSWRRGVRRRPTQWRTAIATAEPSRRTFRATDRSPTSCRRPVLRAWLRRTERHIPSLPTQFPQALPLLCIQLIDARGEGDECSVAVAPNQLRHVLTARPGDELLRPQSYPVLMGLLLRDRPHVKEALGGESHNGCHDRCVGEL